MVEIRQFEEGWGGETRAAIDEILDREAITAGHPFTPEQMVFVAEDAGEMLGGLAATINNQWMHVDLLAIQPQARGRGIGRQLLAEAETLARARGLVGIWLDTHGFQAPDYYPRLGFTEFGRIEDQPPGHTRRFFQKRLDPLSA
ncbi:MAG TPA: GNAT family N-acetyltransferase [Paracoccaceae bacterium]|nr:GNAT family N-acetyltransferase [Paracoccaceae bacterium]